MESEITAPVCYRPFFRGVLWVMLLFAIPLVSGTLAYAQTARSDKPADFANLVTRLTADRADGANESEALEAQALLILDSAALEQLNSATPNLDALNQRLAGFVTHQPPIGESYRVMQLSSEPRSFALVANFGISGPSAIRIYSGAAGQLALKARIDPFAQKDYFDDYTDLVPLMGENGLFLTIAGRTDDLNTGIFTAWRFDGQNVSALWTSDILEQSTYEVAADGLRLTFCGEADPVDFRVCKSIQRDHYVWQDSAWKRVETGATPIVAAKP